MLLCRIRAHSGYAGLSRLVSNHQLPSPNIIYEKSLAVA